MFERIINLRLEQRLWNLKRLSNRSQGKTYEYE